MHFSGLFSLVIVFTPVIWYVDMLCYTSDAINLSGGAITDILDISWHTSDTTDTLEGAVQLYDK